MNKRFTIAGMTALLSLLPALAQAAEEEHHSSGGLPQFDPTWYPSQIFWLAVAFVSLYIVFSRRILPAISGVIENRNERIRGDADTAERLKTEAEAAQQAYEDLLSGARTESTALMTAATDGARAAADKASTAFRDRTAAELATIETRLEAAKAKAMEDITAIAAEIASEAAARIVGIKTDLGHAKTVVQSLNKKEAA